MKQFKVKVLTLIFHLRVFTSILDKQNNNVGTIFFFLVESSSDEKQRGLWIIQSNLGEPTL